MLVFKFFNLLNVFFKSFRLSNEMVALVFVPAHAGVKCIPSLKKRGKGRFFAKTCLADQQKIPLIPPLSKGDVDLPVR